MSRRRFDRRPGGFVLLIVLAVLAVSTLLVANAARILILENRQAERAEDRQQAEWLAESALERAGARLLADRAYQGETWQLSAAELGRSAALPGAVGAVAKGHGGSAVIKIEAVADRPNARRVLVTADFPAGAEAEATPLPHRVSKQIVFELAAGKTPAAGESPPADQANNSSQPSNSTSVVENQP